MGRYVRGQIDTPFGTAMPQLGSTAAVAAGLTAEKAIRFLLERERGARFPYARIVVDKKRNFFHSYHSASVKEQLLGLLFALKSQQSKKTV
ncbi:hypothetical protein IJJ12_01880 [bacterium]|nr:hypothetical protein [bacterium]